MRLQVKRAAEIGVITDIEPYELPSNAWTYAMNVEFDTSAAKIQGYVDCMSPTTDIVLAVYVKDEVVYYCTKDSIWMYNGQHTKLNTTAFEHATSWSITELSEVLVFCSPENIPVYLSPNAATVAQLPNWPVNTRATIITAFNSLLVAIGVQENGIAFPQMIMWSDLAQPNKIPQSWDPTSTTNSAGFNNLSEARGALIHAVEMRDSLFLYTESEVYCVRYVAGNDILRFDKLFDNVSLLNPKCVAKIEQGHVLMTKNDIILHNGSTYQSIVTNKVKNQLFDLIGTSNYRTVQLITYPARNQVLFIYPSQPTANLDRAAVYNAVTGAWSFRTLPETAAACYGTVPRIDSTIEGNNSIIDDDDHIIDEIGKDFVKSSLFIAGIDKKWYALDEGLDSRQNVRSTLERRYLDFDDKGWDSTALKQILEVIPQISGSGHINIYVGVSDSPYEQPTWSNAQLFDIQKDRKADFRVTGRYISIKFESVDDSHFKLLGYDLTIMPRGGR